MENPDEIINFVTYVQVSYTLVCFLQYSIQKKNFAQTETVLKMVKKNKKESIVKCIIEGIQDRKGEKITIADLSGIEDTICRYFVICQGGTPSQTLAIEDSISEKVRESEGRKPMFVDGKGYAHWIVMDYGEVIVHIFTPEERQYYDLDHLWADAKLEEIPDLD